MKKQEPILCYIDGSWAYFTTQSLKKQWGDDWDDAPYESNAEVPYEPAYLHYMDGSSAKYQRDWNADGSPKWEIIKVAWDGDFRSPCDWGNWSVTDINKKHTPWLLGSARKEEPEIQIWAGTTLSKFKKLIRKGGGSVYVEEK